MLYGASLESAIRKSEEEEKKKRSKMWAAESKRFLSSAAWTFTKEEFFKLFERKCANCGSTDNIHLDHIYPRVKDNKGDKWLDVTNLQPLCCHCNVSVKGIKSTDYREYPDKYRALEMKTIFESSLRKAGFDTTWKLKIASYKKVLTEEQEVVKLNWKQERSRLSKCISRYIKSWHELLTFQEVVEGLNIDINHPHMDWIENTIKRHTNEKRKEYSRTTEEKRIRLARKNRKKKKKQPKKRNIKVVYKSKKFIK